MRDGPPSLTFLKATVAFVIGVGIGLYIVSLVVEVLLKVVGAK
jgi:hypothetical protein